ncbi:hypothetical protein Y1Q_0016738 [Alligator mississippiensis]|uniref:Uncharacterized protein n=1 Tax=Alligator mississippiensis TaxID=8496 RepID=A0A151P6R7_ALLMI|nr:hypothetical protein Y1Q_0016738 [Alligator mississippiensis]
MGVVPAASGETHTGDPGAAVGLILRRQLVCEDETPGCLDLDSSTADRSLQRCRILPQRRRRKEQWERQREKRRAAWRLPVLSQEQQRQQPEQREQPETWHKNGRSSCSWCCRRVRYWPNQYMSEHGREMSLSLAIFHKKAGDYICRSVQCSSCAVERTYEKGDSELDGKLHALPLSGP